MLGEKRVLKRAGWYGVLSVTLHLIFLSYHLLLISAISLASCGAFQDLRAGNTDGHHCIQILGVDVEDPTSDPNAVL